LNQSLIYTHPFPLTLLFALLQLSSQKTIVRWKKYWRGIPPPITSMQPVPACNTTFTHCNVTLATRKLSEPRNSSPNHNSFQQCLWLELLYLNVFLPHTHGADSTEVTSHWKKFQDRPLRLNSIPKGSYAKKEIVYCVDF